MYLRAYASVRVIGHYVLLVAWPVGADGAVTARNEGRDPSGSRLCRIRGVMGASGRLRALRPSSVSVNASCAREHFHSYGSPIGGGLGLFLRTLTREVATWAVRVDAWAL